MTKKGKLLIFSYQEQMLCALVQDNRLLQLRKIEADENASILGNIYIGKVQKLMPELGAAFVSISREQNCYLQVSDYQTSKGVSYENGELKAGTELMVQISREATKSKLPSVTTKISLVGTFCVISLQGHGIHFSKKLSKERIAAIKQAIRDAAITKLHDYSVTIRTNAENTELTEQMLTELQKLTATLTDILAVSTHRTCFSCIYQNTSFYEQAIREFPMDAYDEIITDCSEAYEKLKDSEYTKSKLRLYKDSSLSLFNLYGMKQKIETVLSKRVWLPSGGYLVLEQTEAMYVIDVNTGKTEKAKKTANTYLNTNLEAALEIAGQIRARNLSGMILVDFINLESQEENETLMAYLSECLQKDPVPTRLIDMTPLGIVEITRKKISRPISELLGLQS